MSILIVKLIILVFKVSQLIKDFISLTGSSPLTHQPTNQPWNIITIGTNLTSILTHTVEISTQALPLEKRNGEDQRPPSAWYVSISQINHKRDRYRGHWLHTERVLGVNHYTNLLWQCDCLHAADIKRLGI